MSESIEQIPSTGDFCQTANPEGHKLAGFRCHMYRRAGKFELPIICGELEKKIIYPKNLGSLTI